MRRREVERPGGVVWKRREEGRKGSGRVMKERGREGRWKSVEGKGKGSVCEEGG